MFVNLPYKTTEKGNFPNIDIETYSVRIKRNQRVNETDDGSRIIFRATDRFSYVMDIGTMTVSMEEGYQLQEFVATDCGEHEYYFQTGDSLDPNIYIVRLTHDILESFMIHYSGGGICTVSGLSIEIIGVKP